MYLSKLELHGFKSFADRTVLHFDPGITAIVGPNGCGKSNIVDAVRWVIGEQRARILRSEKMENVIFNGTSNRRPVGMSEVLLTVVNNRGVLPTEYSDVEIGRRLYRSGDSDYLVNGVQCRLKDITDLFMDTGMGAGAYSVIELKMVDEILSDNADDRRRLFEEAAGITKYKLRRRQTLNKLDNTQADLTRIRDLTDEIGKQVRSLKLQAHKAERYKAAATRLRELELALAYVEYSRLAERREKLVEEIASLQLEAEAATSRETDMEKSLTSLRLELESCEERLDARRTDLNVHLEKVRDLDTERRLGEERLESARREMIRAQEERKTSDARRLDLERELEDLERSLSDAEPDLERAVEHLEQVRRDHDVRRAAAQEKQDLLQELRREERLRENERGEHRRQLDRLLNRQDLIEEDVERTESDIRSLDGSVQAAHHRSSEADEVRQGAETDVAEARADLERAAEAQARSQRQLEEERLRVRSVERRRDALSAEVQLLESMLTSYEDFSGAVQFLAGSDWSVEALDTIADVLACDDADRVALDAALGPFAGCIVVQTADEARRAIELLRQDRQGLATFVVLERLPDVKRSGDASLAATPLARVVRTPSPKYDALAALLLRDAYIVDTLEEAEALAEDASAPARCFARTGEWIDARGLVHGGSGQTGVSPAAGRLGRREQLGEASSRLEALDRELADLQSEVERRRSELESVRYEEQREHLAETENVLNEAEKHSARLSFELTSSERRRAELVEKLDRSRASLDETMQDARRLETSVQEAAAALDALRCRLEEAETEFGAAEAESREAAGRYNAANVAAVEARNRRDNCRRDIDRARGQIRELEERADARALRTAELENTISRTNEHLEEIAAACARIDGKDDELEASATQAEAAVRQVRESIGAVEGDLRGVRMQREHLMREENQRAVRRAEVQTRSEDLIDHIAEEFSISLPDAVKDGGIRIPEPFDEKDARTEVGELRRSIRALGGINELALEAYEEETERLDFLMQQQEDLERAEEKLLETIDEINTTASRRFLETYEKIREHFGRIFEDLFGAEAAADLQLEDPHDPLETAIEIMARPRGKRPSTISQLSGGEKTLTAIALLFGIYLVKPSPFCILDEVDAPLDDANVERFMRLIRQFSVDTQFILVTHNKRTMEAADRLYGITMQEQGVSRLVGVQFDEAVAMTDHSAPREAA